MENEEYVVALNMNDFKKKIDEYDLEKLMHEKDKILKRLSVPYIYMSLNSYYREDVNIAKDSDEQNRIYVRKKVAMIIGIINAKLNEYTNDFSSCWKTINGRFEESTYSPTYASVKLEGKTVPFADKLNLQGLIAYKRYLLFLCDGLNKIGSLDAEAVIALGKEKEVDKELNREDFYTRYFLPHNINSIFKNLTKIRIVNERLTELENIKNQNSTKENNL